jgi:metallo-beta-lactamase class B
MKRAFERDIMRYMNQTLWLVATGVMVLGLTAVEATGQTPAGAQTWASVAAGLEEERANEALQRIPPFKVFDNLYYVGVGYTGSWLLTTDEGLILLDAVDQRYADQVVANIRKLGFDPADIEYLIIGQAHADHLGAAAAIQTTYGTTVAMGEQDWVFMEQTAAAGRLRADPPRRDREIRDGDTVTLGGTTLRFYSTPGHTPGTISFEFPVYDNGTPHVAFVFGGSAPAGGLEAAEQFMKTVERVEQLQDRVEVSVVNHPWRQMDPEFWSRVDRLQQRKAGESHPFVDPARFRAWIKESRAEATKALQEARAEAAAGK